MTQLLFVVFAPISYFFKLGNLKKKKIECGVLLLCITSPSTLLRRHLIEVYGKLIRRQL